MSMSGIRSTRQSLKEQKASQTIGSGLRTRSKNIKNSPSPRNLTSDAGEKIAKFVIYQDENSNTPFENQNNSSNTAPRKISSDVCSLPESESKSSQTAMVDIGIQVCMDELLDLDLTTEGHSLEYYKTLAQTRLSEVEELSERLNSSSIVHEQLEEVNRALVGENEKLIKNNEEYEEQVSFLVEECESLQKKLDDSIGSNQESQETREEAK